MTTNNWKGGPLTQFITGTMLDVMTEKTLLGYFYDEILCGDTIRNRYRDLWEVFGEWLIFKLKGRDAYLPVYGDLDLNEFFSDCTVWNEGSADNDNK